MTAHAVVKKSNRSLKRTISLTKPMRDKIEKSMTPMTSVATSQKKASTTVDSFKIRKAGNSVVITLPDSIQETLNVKKGDEIQYLAVEGIENAALIVKKEKTNEVSNDTIDTMLDSYFNKYDSVMKDLVDM